MGVWLKIGVTITATPQIDRILHAADAAYRAIMGPDFAVVVTAGHDGTHNPASGRPSLHYQDLAVDLRTGHAWMPPLMTEAEAHAVRDEMKKHLGHAYDVVLEGDHIHAEYDPKTPQAA